MSKYNWSSIDCRPTRITDIFGTTHDITFTDEFWGKPLFPSYQAVLEMNHQFYDEVQTVVVDRVVKTKGFDIDKFIKKPHAKKR